MEGRRQDRGAGPDGSRGEAERWRAFVRACDPMPHVPVATCVVAAGIWTGAVCAERLGWTDPGTVAAWAPLRIALLGAAAVLAGSAAVAARRRREGTGVKTAIAMLGIAAALLGAGLRIREAEQILATPVVRLPECVDNSWAEADGRIVRVEVTVRSRATRIAEGSDILARYFASPPRLRVEVDEITFLDDSGARHVVDEELVLLVGLPGPDPAWPIGTRLEIRARMRGLAASVVPTAREWSDVLRQRGVIGSLSLDSTQLARPIAGWRSTDPLADAVLELRESLRHRVRTALVAGMPDRSADDESIRAMVVALVLGDTEGSYRAIEDDFRAVGLAHILAISGFNLTVLGWVTAAVAALFIRDPRGQALVVALMALAALCVMAPAASAVRSAWMAVLGATGASVRRDWNGDAILAAVATAMLVHEPSVASHAGFQLSFLCVLALRHLAPAIRARWLGWMPRDDGRHRCPVGVAIASEFATRAIAACIAAFLASLPVVLHHFGSMQPISMLLTLLCTPLSTITLAVAYPKCVFGLPMPELLGWLGPVLWCPAWLQTVVVDGAIVACGGPVQVGMIGGAACLVSLAGIFAALLSGRSWIRALSWIGAIGAMLPLHASARVDPAPRDGIEVTMFAVGDGSAYLVRGGGATFVFDAGSSSTGHVAAGALLPAIAEAGGVVDALFISHPNLDHFSAALNLARHARVRKVIVHSSFAAASSRSEAVRHLLDGLDRLGTPVQAVAAGELLAVGDIGCTVLWPPRGFRSRRENDLSLVVRMEHAGTRASVLFSGDIETEPAARLAAMARRSEIVLRSDIVELPHHGSWREAVVEYLNAAAPRVVLQSTARRRFKSDRFAAVLPDGSLRLVTCRDGSIRVHEYGGELFCGRWSGRGGWIPAGMAPRRGALSPDRDDVGASKLDRVADNAVAAILEDDGEMLCGGGAGLDPNGLPRLRCIEADAAGARFAQPDLDIDPCIGRRRFSQRDLAREDACIHALARGGGHGEPRDKRTVELDGGEAEHGAMFRRGAHRILEPVVVLPGRNRNRGPPERRHRGHHRRSEDGCDRVGRVVVAGALAARLGEPGIRKREAPAVGLVVAEVDPVHHGAVHRPEAGSLRRHRLGEREGDRRGAIHGDRPLLHRVGLAGSTCLAHDVLADRLDESADGVAIQQEHGVSIRLALGNKRTSDAQRRHVLERDGHGADPAVIPQVSTLRARSEAAREPLAGGQLEHPRRERCGSRRLASRAGGEERHDVRSRNRTSLLSWSRSNDAPRLGISRRKAAFEPDAVLQEDAHGNIGHALGGHAEQSTARERRGGQGKSGASAFARVCGASVHRWKIGR